MIVEFIGTPGSGKTTMIPMLVEILDDHNYLARTIVQMARPVAARTYLGRAINNYSPSALRDRLLWQLGYFLSYLSRKQFSYEYPDLVSFVQKSQSSRNLSAEELDHVLHWWFHLSGYYHFLKPRMGTNEVLILDEGFVHRVVQLNASDHEQIDFRRVSKYLNLIPRADIVIFVNAPVAECEERIYERGLWTRFQHKSHQQVSQYIANSHLVVNTAIDMIRAMDWVVIEIDNSANISSHAEKELRGKLLSILDHSSTHEKITT